jgi:hypothetical protein
MRIINVFPSEGPEGIVQYLCRSRIADDQILSLVKERPKKSGKSEKSIKERMISDRRLKKQQEKNRSTRKKQRLCASNEQRRIQIQKLWQDRKTTRDPNSKVIEEQGAAIAKREAQ